jgi:hypothetical protein
MRFKENFAKFTDSTPPEIVEVGPSV